MSKASVQKTTDLCSWISAHAGFPSMGCDKLSEEYKLGRWLSKRRSSVKRGFKLSSEEEQVLKQYGLENLFNKSSSVLNSVDMASVYAQWVRMYGRPPSPTGSSLELRLYRWLDRKKRGISKVHPEDLEAINMPNAFEGHTREAASNRKAVELGIWYSKNARTPSRSSKDKEEVSLARWLYRKLASESYYYDSDRELLENFEAGHLL